MNEVEKLALEAQDAGAPQVETPEPQVDAPEAPDAAEVEAEAKRLGWKPRDEWKGDATNWTDAAAYVEYARNTPATVKRLASKLEQQERDTAERLARIERFAADAAKRQQEAHAAELEAVRQQQRAAVYAADTDAFEAARKREDALRASAPEPVQEAKPAPGAAPEVKEWAARNPWFDTDPDMKRAAIALAQKATDAGLGVQAQLAYVDREIASLFADRLKPATPARTFAAVDGGSVVAPVKRGKGWSDIPAAEREMIKRHHIGTVYASEADAAKAYWEMN